MEHIFDDATDEPMEDPVDQPEEAQPEVQFVRIRYNGDTYEVPEHLADAWQRREDDFNRKLSDQATSLRSRWEASREAQPQPERQPAASQDEDLEFFQSPTQAFQRRMAAEREQLKKELREEYQQTSIREKYWGAFYSKNPTLVGKEWLVDALVNRDYNNLKDLSAEESHRLLAEAAQSVLGNAQPETKRTLSERRAQPERPSNPRPQAPKRAEEPPQKLGLSAALNARAEARRRATYNIPDEN